MSNISPLRAALYARFSTDKQNKESADDQIRVCRALAAREGWTVAAEYKDPEISGGTARRPGYQDLLAAARAKRFDVIVAEDSSRLWRNMAEQSPRLAELHDLGIHIVTVSGGIDSRQPGFRVLAGFMGAVNEMGRTESGYRTRRGQESKALKGQPTGGRAYGYVAARDSKSGDLEVDPYQAKIVRRIFQWYAAGKSPRWIAAELNTRGVPAPGVGWNRKIRRKDAKWLQTAVRGIVRNEKYTGKLTWGKTKWKRSAADSSVRRVVPGENPISFDRSDLRIVSDELWLAAQQRIKATEANRTTFVSHKHGYVGHGGKPVRHPLSGLLKCGQCGASYVIADSRSYACASRRDGGPDACSNSLRVPRDLVERAIFDSVAEELLDPAWLNEFSTWFRQQVELGHRARLAATNDAVERQGALEHEIRNTVDAIANGGLQSSRALAEKLRELEAERDRLPRQPPTRNKVVSMIPRLAELFHQKIKELPQLAKADPDRARMLLRRLIGGSLRLVPEDGRLVAEFELNGNRLALFSSSQPVSREIGGSGGRI